MNHDDSEIIRLYTQECLSFCKISNDLKIDRAYVKMTLLNHLGEALFHSQQAINRSKTANNPDRIAKANKTWRQNNPNWVPPAKDPTIAKKISNTKKGKPFALAHRDRTGKRNPKYKPITDELEQTILQLFNDGLSLAAIGEFTQIGPGRVLTSLVATHGFDKDELKRSRAANRKTYPEALFEKLLVKSDIEFVYQHPIYFTAKRRKVFDFLLPKHNTLVEIDSKIWHNLTYCEKKKMPETHLNAVSDNIKNDRFKDELAQKHQFRLIRITDFSEQNFQKIINSIKDPESSSEKTQETAFDSVDRIG